jgi:hypothetical protein
MRVLKTKAFARWTRREDVSDAALQTAVEEMRAGLVDANLGAGLVKKRIARPGRGKSGGWRTLLASNLRDRWVFLYGFAKNERDNVDLDELRALKLLAQSYLGMGEMTIDRLVEAAELMEVKDGESETA